MKKQNIINLIKYYVEKNDEAFRSEVVEIAKDFDSNGEHNISEYLMDLISTTNYYIPQTNYKNFQYLKKINFSNHALLLPESIKNDIIGLVRAIDRNVGVNKIIFYGKPGTGKSESVYQVARLLERDVLSADFAQLIDSRLGQTSKNIVSLFDEISRVQSHQVVILFDEIDAIVLDRINNNDLREMGRVTSTFLKELDNLPKDILIIATTNLMNSLDKAIIRRFDTTISFDRYNKEDLIEIADSILQSFLRKVDSLKSNLRLFHKILNSIDKIPLPGDLTQIIKTAVAFADDENEYDYLRKLYLILNNNPSSIDIQELQEKGFTTREIEILTKIPKSSVSRRLKI